jgi:hypothetical protein
MVSVSRADADVKEDSSITTRKIPVSIFVVFLRMRTRNLETALGKFPDDIPTYYYGSDNQSYDGTLPAMLHLGLHNG